MCSDIPKLVYRQAPAIEVGIFSLQLDKNLTSGEGGLIIANDERFPQRAFSAHGMGLIRVDGRLAENAESVTSYAKGTCPGRTRSRTSKDRVFAAIKGTASDHVPLTLLNIVTHSSGYQMALLEGEAVSTPMVFPGNPWRAGFGCAVARSIDSVHNEGLGRHWMAGYGHVGGAIRQWEKIVGSDVRLISCP